MYLRVRGLIVFAHKKSRPSVVNAESGDGKKGALDQFYGPELFHVTEKLVPSLERELG